ncbi:MAG: DUF1439 domain-containing protein [Thalassotalea sp.]
MKFIIGIMLLVLSNFSSALSYTLEFSEAELQSKLDAMMPLVKKKLFMKITISAPKLDLIDNANELALFANINVSAPGGLNGSGKTKIKGSIDYRPEQGAFYLKNPEVIELHINGVLPQYQMKIKELAQASIAKALLKQPIYKFKDDDMKQKMAKSTLTSVVVKNGKLLVNLSMF